jgi:hypothetical protein
VHSLARKALRSIVLHGIGGFQGSPYLTTRADTPPPGAFDFRIEGDRVEWR